MKMKKIEAVIDALRRYNFALELNSTVIPSESKYSAIFWHIDDSECRECEGHVPNCCDAFQHADTIIEAVWLAAKVCIEQSGLELDLRGF
jgi:hypothetical protein